MAKNGPSRQESSTEPGGNTQLVFDFSAPSNTIPQLWTPDDIYGASSDAIIRQFAEDRRVERKVAKVSAKDLSEYLSMWSNTQPHGGIIFIGVGNRGELLGCKSTEEKHINSIEGIRRFCPDARFESKRVAITNQSQEVDYVIVFRVHYRDDKLVETVYGEAFVREGEEKRRLTETEKREIRLNKGELDVESEFVSLRFPTDFREDLLLQFRDNYIRLRNLEDRYSIQDVLLLNRLAKNTNSGFRLTLAAALLFAKNPRDTIPGSYIRIMRYDGTDEQFGAQQNIQFNEIVEGPLPEQIEKARDLVISQMRSFIRLGADGKFAQSPEYPESVWLEAIVNAAVHRSYNLRNMNIFIKLFENKMVIESPGAFLPPTTADTVYDAHNPRNPNLIWALHYFNYTLCAYEGTRRMRTDMRSVGLPDPVFAQHQSGTYKVTVTLRNNVEHRRLFVRSEAATVLRPEVYKSLTESEKMIVNYLADKAKVNVTDAGLVIGADWRTTKTILDGLIAKKIIERSPGKERSRHRFYFLKKR